MAVYRSYQALVLRENVGGGCATYAGVAQSGDARSGGEHDQGERK
jgi:hypothetical protein